MYTSIPSLGSKIEEHQIRERERERERKKFEEYMILYRDSLDN